MNAALLLLATVPAAPNVPDVSVPPGFAVSLFADNDLAPNIYTMAIDDAGRVLVAGPGYVRVLVDANNDGVADAAIDLIDGLQGGPMGLLAEGDSLFVVVDGGLQRYHGYDGKSKLKGPPETLLKLKTTGEHDAHAVRRGPDGFFYLLCGNMAGVSKQMINTPRSPVQDPVAGALLRISPDGTAVEVVADGFRNAYSFDFDLEGAPFTYDSDNERCVGLPWYEPCRFYHVIPGGNYGWRSPQLGQFWRKPPYFIDCVPPVCYLGRGSPTGVACYRHSHFPEKYRGGFFLADWTFGRIHFVPLTPKLSSYEGKPEVFAEAIGTSGFAPTALAVHPQTGELFVSIGGRGTRGGVYRISHPGSPAGNPLLMAARSLEWTAADQKRWLWDCESSWLLPRTSPADQRARRRALEMMFRWRDKMPNGKELVGEVKPNLSHPDPLIRLAAGRVAKSLPVPVWPGSTPQARLTLALFDVKDEPAEEMNAALAILKDKNATADLQLQALRIIQLALGDMTDPKSRGTAFEGYSFRKPPDARTKALLEPVCVSLVASDDEHVRREAGRILATLHSEEGAAYLALARAVTPTSKVADDLHNFIVLGTLGVRIFRGYTEEIADALVNLEEKADRQKVGRDTFWPLRLEEILRPLVANSPSLPRDVLEHPKFGRPEHLLFVKPLGLDPKKAAEAFLRRSWWIQDYRWSPGLVELMGSLPTVTLRRVSLRLWDHPELRDAILRVLPPQDGDQDKFAVGLGSFDPEVVRLSAAVLEKLSAADEAKELAAAVKALRRLAPEDKAARAAVVKLLRYRTLQKFDADPKAWAEWAEKRRPDIAKLLAATDGFDAAAWKKREAGIPWDSGDAIRGKAVFAKASCAACHDGGRALGPPLLGVAKRFGRDDLLTAILQPSKDVSPRYRATRVTTTDDKVHIGMLIYEAQDGVILQTNADTAVRISGDAIASKRPVEASLMPAGLLDKLTDADVADLFAYLKSLEEPKK